MEHKGTKRIETERLILRPFVLEDAPAAFRNWMSDPQVTKFLRWPTHRDLAVSQRVLEEWVSAYGNPTFYQWAIELKSLGEPIGSIAVVEMNERAEWLEIGYCIGSRWWRNGYTSEALSALLPFFFEEVKAGRVQSVHDPKNPNSGRVMQKCGLRHEATLRRADWNNTGIVDAELYALLAEEYQSMKA